MNTASLYDNFLNSKGVSTDTRTLEKEALFFGLRGPNFNGNLFAKEALEKGAIAVVMDDSKSNIDDDRVVVVENSLKALQKLATYHREQLNTKLIALTGSNGKTTTKELIREVLSTKYKVLATEGNLNNHIGVPLTLLRLKEDHEIGVIEMGANHPGEIADLADITKPNWGYITNFGKAHLEGFGSLEGVVKAKCELYNYLRQNNQQILINGDDAKQLKQSQGAKVSSFGNTVKADFIWEALDTIDSYVSIKFQDQLILSKLYGSYNAINLAAALSFSEIFGVPIDKGKKALSNYNSTNNRSQLLSINETEYVLDAYNANPTSMLAALSAFAKKQKVCKMVILGDMKELGSTAQVEHEEIATQCLNYDFEKIILIGEQFYSTSIKNERIIKFNDLNTFTKSFDKSNWNFNEVLIKGSRALQLERLIPFFKSL
jgi:UDP-N-acetylmuramoyl-tripeptide--D-alanyl-D-alanine ligase